MNIISAKKIINLAIQAGDAVLMQGSHGIGKSDIAKQIAKENGYHIEVLFLSHQEVADLIGIPHIVEIDGKQITKWSVPVWLQRMYKASTEGKKCMLFLDELNRAQIDVRQSALQLVLEGQIHEHKLPIVDGQKTFIVSAVNPADDYQVDELDAALLDRFLTIDVEADAESWLKWAEANNINNIIRSFIYKNNNKLCYKVNDGKGPTPRGWAKLSEFLNLKEKVEEDILYNIIKGKIGAEIGLEFQRYYSEHINFLSVENLEEFIDEQKLLNPNLTLEKLGEKIKEFTKEKETEVIRKKEIANQMIKKYGLNDNFYLLAFLYSFELETLHSSLLEFKDNFSDEYSHLAKTDDDLNSKKLFLKIYNKIAK